MQRPKCNSMSFNVLLTKLIDSDKTFEIIDVSLDKTSLLTLITSSTSSLLFTLQLSGGPHLFFCTTLIISDKNTF